MTIHWILRCGDVIHPLAPGRRVIGRSHEADVPIDDLLASRRHAELIVEATSVKIRDLGSRNGIQIEGQRLPRGATGSLVDGQAVTIGSTRLVLQEQRTRTRLQTADAIPRVVFVGAPRSEPPTSSGVPHETFLIEADRASASGDVARLESATDLLLETLSVALQQGLPADTLAVPKAVGHALTLAGDGVGAEDWIGRVFTLYGAGKIIVPIDVIARIETLAAAAPLQPEPLEQYISAIGETLRARGPRGRAVLTQLERLRRLSRSRE